jgi:hypothetical protein
MFWEILTQIPQYGKADLLECCKRDTAQEVIGHPATRRHEMADDKQY